MYSTLVQLFDDRAEKSPDAVIQMGKNPKGAFVSRSFSELQREYRSIALALRKIGVRRGDNVGIISDNRPEWLAADLAVLSLGAADVPRGRDAMPYEVSHILSVTEARVAFAENDEQCRKITGLASALPELRTVIVFDGDGGEENGIEVIPYRDVLSMGEKLLDESEGRAVIEREIAAGKEDDTATIIFTSGTTGLPKGVMLSHRNMLYQLGEIDKIIEFKPGWKWLSVLPVWHSFERIIQYVAVYETGVLAYSKPIGKIMLTDLLRINPELMCSVPRIWETVKAGVNQAMKSKKPFERRMFSFFVSAAKRYRKAEDMVLGLRPRFRAKSDIPGKIAGFIPYLFFGLLYRIGDRLAFRQIKEKFGTSNLHIVPGLAPEALKDLPAPDRVFLGGTAGNLEEILAVILAKNPAVRIVLTAVTVETLGEAAKLWTKLGLQGADMAQIAVTRTRKAGPYHLMNAQNPVWMLWGEGTP